MLRKLTKSVDVTTAHGEHIAGAVLLDVRTKQELKEARIADAVHVPMASLDNRSRALQRKYEGRKVLVICRSGNRSARAAAHLRSLGVDAWNVSGGIKAWQRRGLPVVGGGS